MDLLYSTPFKVFITGLILAMITTFTWRSVEIQAVYQSATAAAHSAVADTAHYQSAAQGAASTVLPNTTVDAVQQLSNNVVAATVSYQPTNAFSNVFSYLGVPSPNQRITLTGTAPGSLATLSLSVPKTMGAGTTTSIVGSLVNGAGAPIANQTMTLTVSTGNVSSATVITNSVGSFSVNFTAPTMITSVRVSAAGDRTSVSEIIHVVADVYITSNTPAVVGQTVTLKGKVTDGATGLANQTVTLSADPTITFANGGVTTTDANGNFSITFTAPSTAGIVNIVANSDGGYSSPLYSINVMAPTVDFHAISYSIGVYQQITVTGDVKMNGNPEPNMTVTLSQSGSLANLGSVTTTTDSSGNFSFSLMANGTAGTEQLYATAEGGVGTVPLTVTGAQIQFAQAGYQIGVTQPLTLSGTVTSANSSGTQSQVPGTQTIALTGASIGTFNGSIPGPTDTVTATNGTFSVPYQALTTTGTDTIVGTDTAISASGSTTVTVQPAEVTFHPNSYSGQMNSTVTVTGNVTSLGQSGSQVSITQATSVTLNAPAFDVNNVTVTSSSSGAFSYTVTMPNTPTSHSITATALGGTGTASLATAAPNVVVTVSPSSMPDGTSATITVNVNTGSGSNLSGQSVTLTTSGGGTIVTPSGTTGSNGDFTSAFDANSVGTSFTINATVDGAYTGTVVISVVPTITGVNFNTSSWAPTVTVNGDGFGASASNQYLQIMDNTEGWQAGNSNSGMVITEGTWNNNQVVTSGISNYGNYGVWMMFPNQPVTVNVQNPQTGQTASFNTTYPSNAQMPQFVGVTTNNGNLLYGNQATISGYLRLNGGSTPIPNAPIQISVSGLGGGSIVSSTTTSASGYFSVTYTAPNAAGTATFIVTTPDNPTASASVTENVGYMQFTSFSASPTAILPNGQTTLTGQIVYNDGSGSWGWAGIPINFSDTSGASAQSTTTGANGSFSDLFTVGSNAGNDTITATCPWDGSSTSTTVAISYPPYYWHGYGLSNYTVLKWNGSGWNTYASPFDTPNSAGSVAYNSGTMVYAAPMQSEAIAVQPNGDVVVFATYSSSTTNTYFMKVYIWNGSSWSSQGTVFGTSNPITSITVLPNGDVFCGTYWGFLYFLNSSDQLVGSSSVGGSYVYSLPDGNLLTGASGGGSIAEVSVQGSSLTTVYTTGNIPTSTYAPFLFGLTATQNGTPVISATNGSPSGTIYEWNGGHSSTGQWVVLGNSQPSNLMSGDLITLANGDILTAENGGTYGGGYQDYEYNGTSWVSIAPSNATMRLMSTPTGFVGIDVTTLNTTIYNNGTLTVYPNSYQPQELG